MSGNTWAVRNDAADDDDYDDDEGDISNLNDADNERICDDDDALG